MSGLLCLVVPVLRLLHRRLGKPRATDWFCIAHSGFALELNLQGGQSLRRLASCQVRNLLLLRILGGLALSTNPLWLRVVVTSTRSVLAF